MGNYLNNIFTKMDIKKLAIRLSLALMAAVLISFLCIYKKNITVVIDGQQTKFLTFKTTVGDTLKKQQISINSKDKISKELSSKIFDGEIITIKRAVNAEISADGKELSIKSAEDDLKSMLKAEAMALGPEDIVSPSLDTKLYDGINIMITRVKTETTTQSFPIEFSTTIKKSDTMLTSQTKVLQEGEPGERQVTTSIVYEDGKETTRKVVSETTVKEPKEKITLQGTLPTLFASRGGASSAAIKLKTTAYWAVYGIGTTYTASGKKAVRDANSYSTIAVDTKVFPMGTRLYIEGYGYAIAADRGTAIIDNHVDLYFDTKAEASSWGLRYVNAYLVNN